ncbi:MAG: hypothetical protein WBA67_04315 [Jannaschia sp.]
MMSLAFVGLGFGASAMPSRALIQSMHEPVSHGGGCRKSSPPGQCCHAGSVPLHCH